MVQRAQDPEEFIQNCEIAFRELFEGAKAKSEIDFVQSLAPEFRGAQGPGWCTWEETQRAFSEYLDFLKSTEQSSFKIRVALSFYSQLSEASGYYEAPKNLLRIMGGEKYRMWPFLELNEVHVAAGKVIAPNANKIFKDLIGHSKQVGLDKLATVFMSAFSPDIRNGYAHADYIIWSDGLRLRRQAGGHAEVIEWPEFERHMNCAVGFYQVLRNMIEESILSYKGGKDVFGVMGSGPSMKWRVNLSDDGAFSISST